MQLPAGAGIFVVWMALHSSSASCRPILRGLERGLTLERFRIWKAETGKSQATMYHRFAELGKADARGLEGPQALFPQ